MGWPALVGRLGQWAMRQVAVEAADLTRLPKIYLDFNSASDQYVLDSNQIICPD